MNDLVVGVIALLTGAVFCFRGYLAMRVVIPLWGAFAGFMLGAGIMSGEGFLATALAWVIALVFAVAFGLIAYLYYAVSVIIGMLAIGFVLGTSVMVALGVTWSWVIIAGGIVLGLVLAVVGVVGDLPMVLLTVLTALAGASIIVAALMLFVNVVDVGEFSSGLTTKILADDWWWYVIWGLVAGAGMIVQFRDTEQRRETLRAAWRDSADDIR